MRFRIFLAAFTTLLGLGVAAYGAVRLFRMRTFYRWVVMALGVQGALNLLGWWYWSIRRSTADLILLQGFCSVCLEVGLSAWLARLLGLKQLATSLAVLLATASLSLGLLVTVMPRPHLYVVLCLFGVLSFLALCAAGYAVIHSKYAENRDLAQIPYFWCMAGFLLLASGSVTELAFHYWIAVLRRYELIALHGWVTNMPSLLAFTAFARAFQVESRGR